MLKIEKLAIFGFRNINLIKKLLPGLLAISNYVNCKGRLHMHIVKIWFFLRIKKVRLEFYDIKSLKTTDSKKTVFDALNKSFPFERIIFIL